VATPAKSLLGSPWAIALDPGLELVWMSGDDVDVAVQHDAGPRTGADLGEGDRQIAHPVLARLDPARLQPTLDEARRLVDRVGLGGVVGNQAFGEGYKLVHGFVTRHLSLVT